MFTRAIAAPMVACLLLTTVASVPCQEPLVLSGHTDKVYAVAWLPEGRVATAGFDSTVKIWDSASGQTLKTLKGHEGMLFALATSPDGKRLASAGQEGVIKLWDLDSEDAPQDLPGHRGDVYHLVFAADGKQLASCGEDDTRIFIWNVQEAKSSKQLAAEDPDEKNQRRSIFCVDFGPQGKQLVSCGADRTVRLWDLETGKESRRFEGAEYALFVEKDKKIERTTKQGGSSLALYSVAFSSDGKLIAAGGLDKTIRIWDAASGELRHTLTGHPDFVYDLQFSSNGRQLLSCGHNANLFVWNVSDAKLHHETKLSSPAYSAAFSPEGNRIAVTCANANAYILHSK